MITLHFLLAIMSVVNNSAPTPRKRCPPTGKFATKAATKQFICSGAETVPPEDCIGSPFMGASLTVALDDGRDNTFGKLQARITCSQAPRNLQTTYTVCATLTFFTTYSGFRIPSDGAVQHVLGNFEKEGRALSHGRLVYEGTVAHVRNQYRKTEGHKVPYNASHEAFDAQGPTYPKPVRETGNEDSSDSESGSSGSDDNDDDDDNGAFSHEEDYATIAEKLSPQLLLIENNEELKLRTARLVNGAIPRLPASQLNGWNMEGVYQQDDGTMLLVMPREMGVQKTYANNNDVSITTTAPNYVCVWKVACGQDNFIRACGIYNMLLSAHPDGHICQKYDLKRLPTMLQLDEHYHAQVCGACSHVPLENDRVVCASTYCFAMFHKWCVPLGSRPVSTHWICPDCDLIETLNLLKHRMPMGIVIMAQSMSDSRSMSALISALKTSHLQKELRNARPALRAGMPLRFRLDKRAAWQTVTVESITGGVVGLNKTSPLAAHMVWGADGFVSDIDVCVGSGGGSGSSSSSSVMREQWEKAVPLRLFCLSSVNGSQ